MPSICPEYPAWPSSNIPERLKSSSGYVLYLPVGELDTLKDILMVMEACLNSKIYFVHTKIFINGTIYKVSAILLGAQSVS